MFKRLLYTLLFLLIICLDSFSQSSIERQSKYFKLSQEYVYSDIDKFLDSVGMSLEANPEKAFDYIEMAMILSLEMKDRLKQAKTFAILGDYYEHYKQHDLAAINYEKSTQLYGKKNSKYFDNYLIAAQQYYKAGEYQKSIVIYHRILNGKINERQKLMIFEGLGDNNYSLNNTKLALINFHKADSLSKILSEIDKNTEIKLKIASVLTKAKDKSALGYLNDANTQSKTTANTRLQLESQNQIADFYSSNNMYKKEIQSRSSISNTIEENSEILIKQDINVTEELFRNNTQIAQILNSQNQPIEALKFIKKNLSLEQGEIGIEYRIEAAKTQSETYAGLGQGDKAIESYKAYVALVDESYEIKENEINEVIDITKKLADNQRRIELMEQDKQLFDIQIQSLEKDQLLKTKSLKYQRNFIILLFVIVSLLIFALFTANQRIRIQKKHNLFLDLKSLRAQMNPHFIFNALNSVNSFIAKNDELNANKYLTRFSRLIRSILENSEYDFIPLSKEIELLKSYIELEHIRFSDKFTYSFEVDENINADAFKIPPMLIQPYIENAIWHGLRYKDKGGFLKVEIKKEGQFLRVDVIDNGIGREKSQELKTENQKKNKPKGIRITKKRIEILNKLFKKDIKINIEDLKSNEEGTKVTLCIPDIEN